MRRQAKYPEVAKRRLKAKKRERRKGAPRRMPPKVHPEDLPDVAPRLVDFWKAKRPEPIIPAGLLDPPPAQPPSILRG